MKKYNTFSILLVGATGYLGRNLLSNSPRDINVLSLDTTERNFPQGLSKSALVVYLRAISSPTAVQSDPRLSYEVNVERARNFISEALQNGNRVVFAGSDVVYGNSDSDVFKESDKKNPYGLYAHQKSEIEDLFRLDPNFLSLRLSLIYGGGSKLENILQFESPARIPFGVVRNPIHIEFVISMIYTLSRLPTFKQFNPQNTINVGGPDALDVFDLAKVIAQERGFALPVAVPRSSQDIVARPATTRIDSRLAENFLGIQFRP
jgi:dTDP-4-dehydrorhamnose reductase